MLRELLFPFFLAREILVEEKKYRKNTGPVVLTAACSLIANWKQNRQLRWLLTESTSQQPETRSDSTEQLLNTQTQRTVCLKFSKIQRYERYTVK
jgi:hypothetical protein